MNKIQLLTQKASELAQAQTIECLVETYERTETDNRPEIPAVRGWVMDELERRNKPAFDAWIDSDKASPRTFFLEQ